ncbi:tachykinin-4 isoform X2 [Choloepus didactylus]|uniref:tachykinin-4 isoform X2 n=1 Tax=Choloepus didactylus TaxID=27675 RepID=UPI00189D00D7|nr:tachykinin-4 isoform X2 [Choloepus didactylus]
MRRAPWGLQLGSSLSRPHTVPHCAPAMGGNAAKGTAPSIQFQLQQVKRGKASQFFGLMGKRVGGLSPIQSVSITGDQRGRMDQALLDRKGASTGELSPDQEDEEPGSG